MKGYKKLVKNIQEYLDVVEEQITILEYNSDEFYFIMKEFYNFFNELNNLRASHIDEFHLPEEIESSLNKLNTKFKIKNFNQDKNMWLEHIQDCVFRLFSLYNNMPDNLNHKEKRVIRDSVERHYSHLLENIAYYEETFGCPISRDLEFEMKNCIHKFQTNHNVYIRTKEDMNIVSVEIKTIGYDEALDLYEKIKVSDEKEKIKLEKELDAMLKILKEGNHE